MNFKLETTRDILSKFGRIISSDGICEAYNAELKKYENVDSESFNIDEILAERGRRAARISAAIRKEKAMCIAAFLCEIIDSENIKTDDDETKINVDFTPLQARKLCLSLFEKALAQRTLVYVFGGKRASGGGHKSVEEHEEMVVLSERYKERANAKMNDFNEHVRVAKANYEARIKSKRKRERERK